MKFNIYPNAVAFTLLSGLMALSSCSTDESDAPISDNELSFSLSASVAEMTASRSEASEKIVLTSEENPDIKLEITSAPAQSAVSRSSCYTYVKDSKLYGYLWHDSEGWTNKLSPNLIYDYDITFKGVESTLIKVSGEGQHKGLGVGFNISMFGYAPQESPNISPMGISEKAFPYITYTLPKEASSHEDLMLGYYNISEYLGGHHNMKYFHALSAVIVKISPDAYVVTDEIKSRYVNGLRMSNIYVHGKCELEYETPTPNHPLPTGIKWSRLQRTEDAIHADFTSDQSTLTPDGTILTLGVPPAGPNDYFNSTFMMIPQTTPTSANLCVILTERRQSDDFNNQIHFNMGGITFKPGNIYTLTVLGE